MFYTITDLITLVFLSRFSLKDLQLTLEDQKGRVAHFTVALEQERQASARLSEQAERERLSLHRRLQELQVELETERAKALEMSAALGRERELRTGVSLRSGLSSDLGDDKTGQGVDGSLLEKLQRDLDDKHAQVCLCREFLKMKTSRLQKLKNFLL